MERSRYSLEDHLQDLLARYPDLMPGEQLNLAEPRRWLLVSREIGIPDSEAALDRWSLDHLFLDQDGIPTLVEAKRSTDPRIRREVVGQLIEYAANAQSYWTAEQIRNLTLSNLSELTEAEYLAESLGIRDVDEFWKKVKTNLQSGHLRLIFVADEIPRELKRMIEFLNNQMDPVEVYGIELPQYLGSEMQTIVPRLIGNTSQAIARKASIKRIETKWDEESFFADFMLHEAQEFASLIKELHEWLKHQGLRIWWGEGASNASFVAVLDVAEFSYQLIRVDAKGKISIMIDFIKYRPAFEDRDIRFRFVAQMREIGLTIPIDARRPGFSVSEITNSSLKKAFYNWLESLIHEIRNFHTA